MEGTVKFFNESKGYGFITNDDTGKDIFVHVTGLNGETINEGDKVEYVEEEVDTFLRLQKGLLRASPFLIIISILFFYIRFRESKPILK